MDEWIARDGHELEPLGAAETALDAKPIAGKCLSANDLAHVIGKVLERREAAGLGVEMRKIEAPAVGLTAPVLADDTISRT